MARVRLRRTLRDGGPPRAPPPLDTRIEHGVGGSEVPLLAKWRVQNLPISSLLKPGNAVQILGSCATTKQSDHEALRRNYLEVLVLRVTSR